MNKVTNSSDIPTYQHREYNLDTTKEQKKSLVVRVVYVALPYICLYSPVAPIVSIFSSSIRSFNLLNKTISKDKNLDFATFKRFVLSTASVVTLGNFIFKSFYGNVISTTSDIFELFIKTYKKFSKEKYFEGFINLVSFINSFFYLGILIVPSVELILISLLIQILYESLNSYKEYKKENYLEAVGKLGMCAIRFNQAIPKMQMFWHKHKETIFRGMNKTSIIFQNVGAYFASPVNWYANKVIKNWNNGLTSKILIVSTGISLLPMLLVFKGAEVSTSAVGIFLQPNAFLYISGKGNFKDTDLIKIGCENDCAVDVASQAYGGVEHWKERKEEIIQDILNSNEPIHTILEGNSFKFAYEIATDSRIQNMYGHFYFNVGPQYFGQSSGLVILSKFKLTDIQFIPFDMVEKTFEQKMVNKGLIIATAVADDGKELFRYYASHFMPSKDDWNPTQAEINRRRSLENLLIKIMEEEKGKYLLQLFQADTNINKANAEYETSKFSDESLFFDPFNGSDEQPLAATDELIERMFDPSKETVEKPFVVDHTYFYVNGKKWLVDLLKENVTVGINKTFDPNDLSKKPISDHYGQSVTISKELFKKLGLMD